MMVARLSLAFSSVAATVTQLKIQENIESIWHLERDLTTDNAPWLIVGIQG